MNGGGLEHDRLAGEQPVFPAGVAEQDSSGESKLTATRVGAHLAVGGRHRDLQPPTAAEERYAGGKHGLGEFDLAPHRCAAVVDVERRSGHRDAVVVLEADARRKPRLAVRGGHDVDLQRRVDTAQHARVPVPRVIPERGDLPCANPADITVDDQYPRSAHAALTTAPRLPSTAARKIRSRVAASTGIGLPPADGSSAASRPMISALSALTPMSASECGMPRLRRISSTHVRKPSKPRPGRSRTRAMTSVLSAIAVRLNAITYGRMTAFVRPGWVLNHEPP